jgi:hypothetical protein
LQPLFACHGRATQAEKAAWRRQQELRAGRLDSLAVVVPKAGMVRAVLRMVPVAAAATSRHLSAVEASASCFAVWLPAPAPDARRQTGLQ